VKPPVPFGHLLTAGGDLPFPPWLFIWAACLTLAVSFFAVAAASHTSRLQREGWRPAQSRLARLAESKPAAIVARALGLLLLAWVIADGIIGDEPPYRSFAVTFTFVTVWIGLPVAAATLGDHFAAFDPWRTLARAAGRLSSRVGARRRRLRYPERLGRWPAAAAVLAFVWAEVVLGSDLSHQEVTAGTVAAAAGAYSLYTLTMMSLFGARAWSSNGELFSVYARMFGSLSPFSWRDGRLGRRRALTGPPSWGRVPGSDAVALAAIAGTTYDGAQQGVLASLRRSLTGAIADLGAGSPWDAWLVDTSLLVGTVVLIAAVYLLGILGMRRIPGSPSVSRLRLAFSHTLIPIALAYLVAHYFSYFAERIQAQLTFLISDPLGTGADLLGLAGYEVETGIFSTLAVWTIQMISLVGGHILGLVLAHDRSVSLWTQPRLAARSQYWMLIVMMALTSLGLFLLSVTNS